MGFGTLVIGFLPYLIGVALAIYLLTLVARFVRAFEKIADNFDSK